MNASHRIVEVHFTLTRAADSAQVHRCASCRGKRIVFAADREVNVTPIQAEFEGQA